MLMPTQKFSKGNQEMLINKANCVVEISCWTNPITRSYFGTKIISNSISRSANAVKW